MNLCFISSLRTVFYIFWLNIFLTSIETDMVNIDNVNYDFVSNSGTIYQFCYSKNIVLPCFCYHEKLSIAGNCRMCLVELNGALAVSCAVPILDNVTIVTKSQRLLHARESVLEFLLINHPLDCPICDQGGECDLQDISMNFGLDRGRYYENKRSVDNLNCCGPLIKTVMTRCIHCTRCVRFLNEYCDSHDLGVIGRGSLMEIGSYLEKFTLDALSGNIIDLCPVGALTSMPYAFTARPWELKTIESIDVLDALASSIRIDIANNQVNRISPVLMESLNEDWLTNKARFSYDALSVQRLYYPKFFFGGQSIVLSWFKALSFFLENIASLNYSHIEAVTGMFTDLETTWSLKSFFNSFGCGYISYENLFLEQIPVDFRFTYLLNLTLQELEDVSFVILLNTNVRLENPLINSRIRKNYLKSKGQSSKMFTVLSFGQAINYAGYPINNLGNNPHNFISFIQGKYYFFNNLFFNPNRFMSLSFFNVFLPFHLRPMLLAGSAPLAFRRDVANVIRAAMIFTQILERHVFLTKNIFNMMSSHLGELSFKEIAASSQPRISSANTLTYYVGSTHLSNLRNNSFIVYQNSHMPFNMASVRCPMLVLPTTTYTERVSTYINLEGRIRTTKVALASSANVLADTEVLRLMNILKRKKLGHNFSFLDNFYETMAFSKYLINYECCFLGTLKKFKQDFSKRTGLPMHAFENVDPVAIKQYLIRLLPPHMANSKISASILAKPFINYYAIDFLSRFSRIMGLCSLRVLLSNFSEK